MWLSHAVLKYRGHSVEAVKFPWGLEQRPLFETVHKMHPSVAVKWVDRFSAVEAIFCEWSLTLAFEKAYHIQPNQRTESLRTLHAEIQRMVWLTNFLIRIFRALRDEIRLEQAFYLREAFFQIQELFCGSRVLPQIFTLGGLERDLSLGEIKKLRELCTIVEQDFESFFSQIEDDKDFLQRLSGVLVLDPTWIEKYHLGGPVARAAGYLWDDRQLCDYGIYKELEWRKRSDFFPELESDALGRLRACLFEVTQSLYLLKQILTSLPSGSVLPTWKDFGPLPEGVFWGMVEGGSGKIFAGVSQKEIQITSPSRRIGRSIEKIVQGLTVDDFELGLASLGYEFSEGDLA